MVHQQSTRTAHQVRGGTPRNRRAAVRLAGMLVDYVTPRTQRRIQRTIWHLSCASNGIAISSVRQGRESSGGLHLLPINCTFQL